MQQILFFCILLYCFKHPLDVTCVIPGVLVLAPTPEKPKKHPRSSFVMQENTF